MLCVSLNGPAPMGDMARTRTSYVFPKMTTSMSAEFTKEDPEMFKVCQGPFRLRYCTSYEEIGTSLEGAFQ